MQALSTSVAIINSFTKTRALDKFKKALEPPKASSVGSARNDAPAEMNARVEFALDEGWR